MGKGHRIKIVNEYWNLLYSRNMTQRHERLVRRSTVYAEVVRLCGLVKAERMLLECPREDRDRAENTSRDILLRAGKL